MARMVELIDVEAAINAAKAEENARWNRYLNGKPWVFEEGIDYSGTQQLHISHVRYQARKRGYRINLINRTDNSFTIIALPIDDAGDE